MKSKVKTGVIIIKNIDKRKEGNEMKKLKKASGNKVTTYAVLKSSCACSTCICICYISRDTYRSRPEDFVLLTDMYNGLLEMTRT